MLRHLYIPCPSQFSDAITIRIKLLISSANKGPYEVRIAVLRATTSRLSQGAARVHLHDHCQFPTVPVCLLPFINIHSSMSLVPFALMASHLHLKFYKRLPKSLNSVIFRCSAVSLKVIFPFTFPRFLFKNSSLHLCISEHFRNTWIAFSSSFHNRYFLSNPPLNPHNVQLPILNLQLLLCEKFRFKGSRTVIILLQTERTSVYIIKCKWRGLFIHRGKASSQPLFFHSFWMFDLKVGLHRMKFPLPLGYKP